MRTTHVMLIKEPPSDSFTKCYGTRVGAGKLSGISACPLLHDRIMVSDSGIHLTRATPVLDRHWIRRSRTTMLKGVKLSGEHQRRRTEEDGQDRQGENLLRVAAEG